MIEAVENQTVSNVSETRTDRPRRKRVGSQGRLEWANRYNREERSKPGGDGFVYRVVNDVNLGDRVREFQDAGYEICDSSEKDSRGKKKNPVGQASQVGTVTSRVVGTDDFGKNITGVLMRQRKEFWDEDQAEKAQEIYREEIDRLSPANAHQYGGAKVDRGGGTLINTYDK